MSAIEEIRFGFSQPQHDFLSAQETYVAAVAGFGSGKTLAALARIIQNMLEAPGIDQAYLAPTYPLIRDIFYPAVDKMLPVMDLDYNINKSEHTVDIAGLGKIFCRTMDNPGNIIGWEVADAVLDEFDILAMDKAKEVFRKTKARLRQNNPTGRKNQLFVTTTPEGFKATYELFKKNPLKDSRLIQLSTYANARHLPDNYIQDLLDQYPPQLIAAYLMGEFVNLTSGSVYGSYDREEHRSTEIILPNEPLYIGQDFNVCNMASSIYVKRDKVWHIVDEIVEGYDTPSTIISIQEKFPDHSVTMYPDASGKNRKSQGAASSDIALLKAAGFKIKAKDSNPFVKDRVNAVNAAFTNGLIKVNDARAPTCASNLEQQVYDKNGEPDKKSGNDHQNDATGYPVAFEMPIKKPIIIATGIGSAA